MSTLCEVCQQQPFKYKCPACKKATCSLPCSKKHKEECTVPIQQELSSPSTEVAKLEAPAAAASLSTPTLDKCFENLRTSSEYKNLLRRYPSLASQLACIYNATVEPPDADLSQHYSGGHQHRGYRGSTRGHDSSRLYSPWTQQKADNNAVRILRNVRESEDEESREGMREFLELVSLSCSSNSGSTRVLG